VPIHYQQQQEISHVYQKAGSQSPVAQSVR